MFNKIEEEQLRSLLRKNINMHKRRVVNAADAVDPGDYVTLRQVNGTVGAAGSILIPTSVAAELEAHASSHEFNGTDELNVTNLPGLLAEAQTPLEHHDSHETGTVDTDGVYQGTDDELLVYGLYGLLEHPQDALPHAEEHADGGLDPIRIDELWEGTDITTLDSSTTRHGLLPKLSGSSSQYLNGLGAFATPAGGSGALTLIAENLLVGDVASVSFTSIASSYRHLKIVIRARTTQAVAASNLLIQFNGDTAGNYDYQQLLGTNTTAAAGTAGAGTFSHLGNVPGTSSSRTTQVGIMEVIIPHYADTVFEKMGISVCADISTNPASGNNYMVNTGFNWRSTAAINRVDILAASGNIKTGSLISLYGMS